MKFSDIKKALTGEPETKEETKKSNVKRPQKLATIVEVNPPAPQFPEEGEEDRQL